MLQRNGGGRVLRQEAFVLEKQCTALRRWGRWRDRREVRDDRFVCEQSACGIEVAHIQRWCIMKQRLHDGHATTKNHHSYLDNYLFIITSNGLVS
jgi:hypothetical protein